MRTWRASPTLRCRVTAEAEIPAEQGPKTLFSRTALLGTID